MFLTLASPRHTATDCAPLREQPRATAHTGVFFIPLNLLIAVTSVLSFIAGEQSSVSIDSTLLNIVTGCVAAFGVFWNSCDRMLNYKSRADMHTGAKMVCKELLADLDFSLIKYSTEDAEQILKEFDLDAIKTKLDQVQESCTSAVPDAINQAFKQINHMVPYELSIKGLADGDGEDIQTIRIANVLLCKEIAKSKLWPMKLPGANVHKQAEKALHDVLRNQKKKDLLDVWEEKEKENKKEKEKKGKMQGSSLSPNLSPNPNPNAKPNHNPKPTRNKPNLTLTLNLFPTFTLTRWTLKCLGR